MATVTAREKVDVIYARVSTPNQRTDSQLEDLRRWAIAQKGRCLTVQDKFTGKTMERPGMAQVMQMLHEGRLRRVIVWRLDRLGRTTRELLQLFEDLQSRGVGLVSLKEGLDLGTPAGRMVATILASLAQWETELRGERVAEGIAAAKRQGKTWGGSKPGWHWKVKPEQLETIQVMTAAGKGVSAIARATGLSRTTIYKLLEPDDE